MNDYFVDFEVGKLLKEKKFDEENLYYYDDDAQLLQSSFDLGLLSNSDHNVVDDFFCVAPTISSVFKWFYENHGIHITIFQVPNRTVTMEQGYFFYRIQKNRRNMGVFNDTFMHPNEAANAAIKYCLENLI